MSDNWRDTLNNGTEPGNPDNWPSRIARSHKDLDVAIYRLLEGVDEANARFAITEFIRERLRLCEAGYWRILGERDEVGRSE